MSTRLSVHWTYPMGKETKALLQELGCEFGREGIRRQLHVTLPPGWRLVTRDKIADAAVKISDERKRCRFELRYLSDISKSFYGKLMPRYSVHIESQGENYIGVVHDGITPIYRSDAYVPDGRTPNGHFVAAFDDAMSWLSTRYPDCHNPRAYWD